MMQIVLIGIAAGATSALLFTSLASGAVIAVLLCLLAPLPIMIAALGWSHWAALIAALVGTIGVATAIGAASAFAFLLGAGIPAWWLGYLALLARPVGNGGEARLEWYPVGSLVLWSAVLGVAVAVATLVIINIYEDPLRQAWRTVFEQMIGARDSASPPDVDRLVDTFLMLAPPIAAATGTFTNLFNLWLAGRIVRVSNRLRRPWPDPSSLTVPRALAGIFIATIGGWFLPDQLGALSGTVAASLVMTYAIVGFAVMHTITRGMSSRGFVIAGVYAAVMILGWPLAVMTMLGLADTLLDLRAKRAVKGGPPNLRS